MYRIEENGESVLGMCRFLMMENAGHGVADFVAHKFKNLKNKRIVTVCGTGNNGGDGFVASRHLAGYGAKMTVIFLGAPLNLRARERRPNGGLMRRWNPTKKYLAKG